MNRRWQTLTLWLLWAWTVMTLTHELGHVVGGVITGARLSRLELRPWHLPHSLFLDDKHPLVTLWAGPVLGCAVPLLVAAVIRRPATWFVAWFCLLANGAYLVLGYLAGDAELDSTKMVLAGTNPIVLVAVSGVALVAGYYHFRQSCVGLMSGQTEALAKRRYWFSAAALAAVVLVQSIVGQILIVM